jgi:general secretion pathway protein E
MNPAITSKLSDLESRFLDHLASRGRLNALALERLQRLLDETSDHLAAIVLKLGHLSEDDLAREFVEFSALPPLCNEELPKEPLTAANLSAAFLRTREIVPIAIVAGQMQIACWDVLDDYAVRALAFASGLPIARVVTTRRTIQSALDTLYPVQQPITVGSTTAGAGAHEDEEIDRLKDLASEAPVIRLVQRLINAAVAAKASDIHLEPSSEALHVRFRTDGLLRDVEQQPKDLGTSVVSRIKVMAGLNIAERRLPQDGRIRVTAQGKEIDFRVATSPTLHGESVVLRILDRDDIALDFDALGFDAELQSVLRTAIARPHGIFLVTGPTGSGKTTTLYAALKEINTRDRKILTVEDPVEYVLNGVNQVPLRPQAGLTFATALRAFLRQDPDVLMVGEIRDRETAEIAIQAALTGHLLLSTLHTNSAAAAITRLLDMGIDDYLLTSTLHLVLGQRLVRKLCERCKQAYSPPEDMRARLDAHVDSQVWYRAIGCDACQGTGYKGRTTILEALPMNDLIRSKVLERSDANIIEHVAMEQGMRTLFEHGLERLGAGVTSMEEVRRVTTLNG